MARQLFDEALAWIASNDRGWFFSYENICETLEINPEYLRRGLETWRQNPAAAVVARAAVKNDSPRMRAAS